MSRMALTLVIAISAIAPTIVSAEECAAIATDLDRLACYDKESGRTPVSVPLPITESTTGKWQVDIKKSDFEDTTDVYMILETEEPVSCGGYGAPQKASLVLRCMENKSAVYITGKCHLASGFQGYGKVDIRLDEQKSFTRDMDASTDNSALGHFSGGQAIPLMKQMLGKQKMLARFTPFNENAVSVSFDLNGIDDAIKPLREECGW